MLSIEMKEFSERYSLGEEGEIELIKLFNKSLIEISGKILETYDVNEKKVKSKIEIKRKFASKKAEEYAYENGISIEEFEIEKISKKDVEEKIRKRIKWMTQIQYVVFLLICLEKGVLKRSMKIHN